ncbi:ABC transporter ATP-binding protein [Paractinoplanes lichenicola]|uniref:ABC transporter ATP-binding protein n=1 Tax=Paractinoplanes lichenicola TaxID=2802976 RepID=A0ABS1VEZ6_9ACTN|nr:ABC transporter ATP-binding protein [Actinoplanes lichenicola]MBL7253267.1 ABC transporter ATP-binding protein [Actinoplanes lichenicola]
MRTPDEALAVEGVSHSYGLRDCSFTVRRGAVVALLGRNGAGKTTVLRAVAGLLRPYGGRVLIFGEPVERGLARIGYVGQQAALYPMLTVAQTLRLGARLNPRWDRAHAISLLGVGGLRATARVGSLSVGQRTRLALVLALGKRPDLLVLDEPLAGLDPVARTELIGALMADVADRGTTVLMSSHVVAEIEGVCDHVVVLGDGRVRLAAEIEPALDQHRVAAGPVRDLGVLDDHGVIELRRDGDEFTALVRAVAPLAGPVTWHRPTLDELLLAYLRAGVPQPIDEVTPA